jgi:hypothetical protein
MIDGRMTGSLDRSPWFAIGISGGHIRDTEEGAGCYAMPHTNS